MTIRYSPVFNVSLYSAFTLNFNYNLEKESKNSHTKLCLLILFLILTIYWLQLHLIFYTLLLKVLPFSNSNLVDRFPTTEILSPNPFFFTISLATLAIGLNACESNEIFL